jgi:hypothetical protein
LACAMAMFATTVFAKRVSLERATRRQAFPI